MHIHRRVASSTGCAVVTVCLLFTMIIQAPAQNRALGIRSRVRSARDNARDMIARQLLDGIAGYPDEIVTAIFEVSQETGVLLRPNLIKHPGYEQAYRFLQQYPEILETLERHPLCTRWIARMAEKNPEEIWRIIYEIREEWEKAEVTLAQNEPDRAEAEPVVVKQAKAQQLGEKGAAVESALVEEPLPQDEQAEVEPAALVTTTVAPATAAQVVYAMPVAIPLYLCAADIVAEKIDHELDEVDEVVRETAESVVDAADAIETAYIDVVNAVVDRATVTVDHAVVVVENATAAARSIEHVAVGGVAIKGEKGAHSGGAAVVAYEDGSMRMVSAGVTKVDTVRAGKVVAGHAGTTEIDPNSKTASSKHAVSIVTEDGGYAKATHEGVTQWDENSYQHQGQGTLETSSGVGGDYNREVTAEKTDDGYTKNVTTTVESNSGKTYEVDRGKDVSVTEAGVDVHRAGAVAEDGVRKQTWDHRTGQNLQTSSEATRAAQPSSSARTSRVTPSGDATSVPQRSSSRTLQSSAGARKTSSRSAPDAAQVRKRSNYTPPANLKSKTGKSYRLCQMQPSGFNRSMQTATRTNKQRFATQERSLAAKPSRSTPSRSTPSKSSGSRSGGRRR